mgnify:CR=1 FL=1
MMQKLSLPLVGLSVLVCCFGCGDPKYFPVTGIVVDEQGKPFTELNGATVVFEAVEQSSSAVGEVQADGTFSMSSETADDGCVPGKQRVAIGLVFGDGDGPQVRVVDPQYDTVKTSELTVDIEKKHNHIRLQLKRFAPQAE